MDIIAIIAFGFAPYVCGAFYIYVCQLVPQKNIILDMYGTKPNVMIAIISIFFGTISILIPYNLICSCTNNNQYQYIAIAAIDVTLFSLSIISGS